LKRLFKLQSEKVLVFTINVPSMGRLLQGESDRRDEAVEKKCKSTFNVDDSEYNLHSWKEANHMVQNIL